LCIFIIGVRAVSEISSGAEIVQINASVLSNLCFILEYVFVKCSVTQGSACNWLPLPCKSCLKIICALKSVLFLRFLCRWP